VAFGQFDSGGVGFRRIEKDGLAGHARREAPKEQVGDAHVVGEQRPDLETSPARAEDSVARKSFIADDAQGLALLLPDPAAQERGARYGEHGLVVARDLFESDEREIDEARWGASSADASIANIAVGKLEPGLAIIVLLGDRLGPRCESREDPSRPARVGGRNLVPDRRA